MRVLLVDQDSAMLEALVRALREHFVIDAVTSKGGCFDLMRVNEFELIVACERLEDGSGLELLGQVAKRWPATLRVFAADRERLKLLQGRLGPFQLFQTLSYPIDARKLFSTLSLASAAHNAEADTVNFEHVELSSSDADPPPPEPVAPPRAAPVARSLRRSRHRAQGVSRGLAPTSSSSDLIVAATVEDAATIAPAARSNIDPLSEETRAGQRKLLMIAGGALAAAVLALLAIKLFGGHTPPQPAPTAAQASPHYSQAVTDLVSSIEAEFTRDDFRTVRADVAQLRELAPDHPRLQFFDSLLSRLGKKATVTKAAASTVVAKAGSAPKPSQPRKNDEEGSAPGSAAGANPPAAPVVAPVPPVQPAAAEPNPPVAATAGVSTPAPTPTATAVVAAQPAAPAPEVSSVDTNRSFSGRTIEESAEKTPPVVKASATVRSSRPLLGPDGAPIVIAEAQLIRHVDPEYPSAARRKGVEGYVDLHYTVTAKGAVENVTVVGSDPAEVFDKAAMEAVARWRYDPKMVDGVASATEMNIRLQFKLDSKD